MSQVITNYTLSAQDYTLKQEERLDQEKRERKRLDQEKREREI